MLGSSPAAVSGRRQAAVACGATQRRQPAAAAAAANMSALAAVAARCSARHLFSGLAASASSAARASSTTRTHAAAGDDSGGGGEPYDPPQRHELVDWVLANGGRVEACAPANLAGRDGGSGWGLKATRGVRAGERLVELPPSCMCTYDDGHPDGGGGGGGGDGSPTAAATTITSTDPALLALISKVPEELWGGRLALALLAERAKGAESRFAPYVRALPLGFPGVPMFFNREALEAVDYPPVVEQVKRRGRWLARFASTELQPAAAGGGGGGGGGGGPFGGAAVDVNALGWGLAAVTSRAFRVRGPSRPAALLPLVDMCNHSFEPNAEVVPSPGGGGGVALVAKRDVAAGEPILLSYGPLSNDFLLMDYGFLVDGNPHDRVAARFDVALLSAGAAVANVMDASGKSFLELDASPAWRRRALEALRLAGPGADLGVSVGGPRHVEPRLLAAARVLVARYQSETEGRSPEALGDWDKPLSRENEGAALRTLVGACSVLLSNFSTSLAEDEELLAAGRGGGGGGSAGGSDAQQQQEQREPLTEEMRLAVRFRAERKRTLLAAIRGLGDRAKAVASMTGLREGPAAAPARKGERPPPATNRGFATGSGGGGGRGGGGGKAGRKT